MSGAAPAQRPDRAREETAPWPGSSRDQTTGRSRLAGSVQDHWDRTRRCRALCCGRKGAWRAAARRQWGRRCMAPGPKSPGIDWGPCSAGLDTWSPKTYSPVRGGVAPERRRRRGLRAGKLCHPKPRTAALRAAARGWLNLGSRPRSPAGPWPPSEDHPPTAPPGWGAPKPHRFRRVEREQRSGAGVTRRSDEGPGLGEPPY
ncbi:hypothetical protein NDU88_002543 [Pleurodeles waltl]|uniref:Uncharacterized protein n=1 Tax=Pleurodeles waltl TaxID=8319 RepID=A0AAV7P788_PLEWA|nr:hypothetical protein NDU88_002543 [Pleurodeles waltl]